MDHKTFSGVFVRPVLALITASMSMVAKSPATVIRPSPTRARSSSSLYPSSWAWVVIRCASRVFFALAMVACAAPQWAWIVRYERASSSRIMINRYFVTVDVLSGSRTTGLSCGT